mmetsp:Transcript_86053/g.243076  ORF Transcript_86053/g.243076 Transcript_86053/m.243076 type:complete len:341 (-) Transcript_86053:89-1111(-)
MGNTVATADAATTAAAEPRGADGVCWKMTAIGDPSDKALLVEEARPWPAIGPTDVLVSVGAAALNPIDYKLMMGKIAVMTTPPFVGGFDFAGTVEAAGAESGFEKGQKVFGDVPNMKETSPYGGSLSTYMLVPSNKVALQPPDMTHAEASSLSLVGQTVLDCLAMAAPSAGARVLILGASGGVGTSAVQIMKAEGLFVIGVCSGKNAGLVADLGADRVVDYTAEDWSETLAGDDAKVDVVFDFAPSGAHSTESWEKATKVLSTGGKFITISGSSADGSVTVGSFLSGKISASWTNTFGNHKYYSVLKVSDALKLQRLAKLAAEGKLKPVVDTVYPWEVRL